MRGPTATLCATQLIGWGVTFYALPVLASSIAADEGWSVTQVLLALAVGQLVSAVCGLWVGRRLDRHGPRHLMTAGSAVCVVGVVAVSASPSYSLFVAAWALAGVGMAATLYPPAFAALTGWAGADVRARTRALTALTLVGGLASTVFAPLTAVLEVALGWRGAYLWLALVLAATVPLHWWGLRRPWRGTATEHDAEVSSLGGAGLSWDPTLARVGAALALATLCTFTVMVVLVPLLESRGLSTTTAASALGVGGAAQVIGRLFYGAIRRRVAPRLAGVLVLLVATLATLGLAVGGSVPALVAWSLLAGAARGLLTLVHATAVSDRWGHQGYGRRNAVVSAGVTVATASAPGLGALVAATGNYTTGLVLLAAGTAAAAVLLPGSPRRPLDGTGSWGTMESWTPSPTPVAHPRPLRWGRPWTARMPSGSPT